MANKKISELDAFQGNVQNDDLFEVVDVSDSSMAPTGTNKKVTWQEMKGDLNDTYLRLNGANGPITGNLAVSGDIDITGDYKKNGAPLNFDADYLKLDASNDPITGDLGVSGNIDITGEYLINGLPIKFDSIGWEIAELDDTPGAWQANKTELQRAYNTGIPVWIPPGVYELDDCVLNGQTDCIIWANAVTLKMANDPGLGNRTTPAMLELQNHRDTYLAGEIFIDGNGANAFAGDKAVVYVTDANENGRYFVWDDLTITDINCDFAFQINRVGNNRTYKLIRGGKVKLLNGCKVGGFRIRAICESCRIDYFYTTDGDPNNEKGTVLGWTNMRGSLIFEGGEASIYSSYSDSFHLGEYHAQYLKWTAISHFGVKSAYVGKILIEDCLRNSDGSDAQVDPNIGQLVLNKRGGAVGVLDDQVRNEVSYTTDVVIIKNTNNGKALPNAGDPGNTTVPSVVGFQQASGAPKFRINYIETDCANFFYSNGDNTDAQSELGSIGTLIYRGQSNNSPTDLSFPVDNIILDNRYPEPGETRSIRLIIEGLADIGSIVSYNTSTITINPSALRVSAGEVDFWEKSNIKIRNANLSADNNVLVALTDTNFQIDGSVGKCAYLKLNIYDSNIQSLRSSLIVGGSGSPDFTPFRDRVEINFYNSIIRNRLDPGFKQIFLDAATGARRSISPAGATTLTSNVGPGETLTATNDLPTGLKIYGSKCVKTILLDRAEVQSGISFTRDIDSSGFTGNLTPGSTESLQDLADAVDGLSGGGGGGIPDAPSDGTTYARNNAAWVPSFDGQVKSVDNSFYLASTVGTLGGANDVGSTSNIGIGASALNLNTTGNNNVAIGRSALALNTTGSTNIAIGSDALSKGTPLNGNIAIGSRALEDNEGERSIALGTACLAELATGNENTAVGFQSLQFATNTSRAIALGTRAGKVDGSASNVVSATDCVFIGADTKPLLTGSTNEIVIGEDATGNGSNTATLGNTNVTDVYFGNGFQFSNAAAPTAATDPGKVGEIRIDAGHIYYCSAPNTWVRSPLTTW